MNAITPISAIDRIRMTRRPQDAHVDFRYRLELSRGRKPYRFNASSDVAALKVAARRLGLNDLDDQTAFMSAGGKAVFKNDGNIQLYPPQGRH